MPAYRDGAAPAEMELVPGATPRGRLALTVACGLALAAAGLGLGVVALGHVDVWSTGERVSAGGLALLVLNAGFYALWSAWTAATTHVRLVRDGEDVVLEWRRRGRVLRAESVPRADVREVAMLYRRGDDGLAWYKLVLRTARGDLAFTERESRVQAPLGRQRRQVETFLVLAPTRDAGD